MMTYDEAEGLDECPKCGECATVMHPEVFAVQYRQDTVGQPGHLEWSCIRCSYTFRSETKDADPA